MSVKPFQKILLILAVLLCGIISRAQNGQLAMDFIESTITTDNSGIINAQVRIKNNSSRMIEGLFDVHSNHEDLYLVQRKSKSLILQPNDSIFIPVKGIISTTAIAGNKVKIEAIFEILGTNQVLNTEIPVIISEKKQVKMFLTETNLIYEKIGDSLNIPIRLYNEGNTSQSVTIVARYPNFINKNAIESKTINIAPYSDTIIILRKEVTKSILNEEDFTVTINALYSNGDIIGSGYARASSLKQNRRYTVPYQEIGADMYQQPNQATASYQRNNNETGIYYLYANAETKLSNASVKVNLDMNWWDNSDMVYLRNTWLSYDQKKFGLKAGNIVKFSDINLVGRGGQAYFNPNEKSSFEVGIIDKAYNLVDDFDATLGKAGWVSYSRNGGSTQKGYDINVFYDSDDYYKTDSYLGSSRFSILKKDNFELTVGGAISNSTSQENNESKIGGAGELVAIGRINNFTYSSANYLSTSYFAGLRKGLLNLNERISYNLEKYTFWGGYTQLTSDPEYFANENASMQFSNTRYDLGASKRYSSFSVSLNPYFYTEKRSELLYGQTETTDYSMDAARASFGFMYFNHATRQNVSLTLEGGLFDSGTLKNQIHYRANINYNWKMLNVTAFYQNNFFYLGEVISFQQFPTEDTYYNFSVSPSVRLNFFDKKLELNAAVLYSKNNFVPDMRQANGRIDYNLSKDFTVFATGFYSEFSGDLMKTNSILAGVTKRFNPIRVDHTKSDLEVYVYYEINGKGALDAENLPAANQLVIVQGKAFKTDNNGMIKYRALPAGDYEIRPMINNEWHAQPLKVNINQDTRVTIGLNKTCTIKGNIFYQSTEKSYQISKRTSGLSIIAIDDTGNVFHTRTDDTGNFILYVPKGNYTITLEKSGVSEYVEIENNNQIIQAQPSEIKEINFKLNVKEKRVETRKFTSRGFPAATKGEDDKKKKK